MTLVPNQTTERPRITVASIIEENGRFLLVEEQRNGRLVLNQPAGHLEHGESLIEATIRETREETGWHFTPESLLGIYQNESTALNLTYIRFAFRGNATPPNSAPKLDEGIVRSVWMTLEEIQAEHARLRNPLVLRCIQDWLNGQSYPLDWIPQGSDPSLTGP
jgi:ADP-ribose pyrophosphatase YjhB (NUDIX family)